MSETQKPDFNQFQYPPSPHYDPYEEDPGEQITQQMDIPTHHSLITDALRKSLQQIPPKIQGIIRTQQEAELQREEEDYEIHPIEAKNFVSLLLSKAAQKNLDDVPLFEAGLELINMGIGQNGAPTAEEIIGLRAVFDAQNIEQTDEKTYKSRFDLTFGPYDDDQEDVVQSVIEKLNPNYWLLPDEEREFYTKVLGFEEMVSEPDEYMPMPHRRMADQKIHRLIKNPKKRKQHEKDQVAQLAKREEEGKKPITKEDIELTKKIHAHWQGKPVEEMVTHVILKPKDQEKILELVKAEAQEKLQRDNELQKLAQTQ